jgi:outer membrane lipoprotein SlyB
VRAVRVEEDHAPVGTIAGAALGGILGSQIGHGAGSAAGAVLGAVGGGLAGNAIEHRATGHDGQEIVVRLDDGSTIALVQGGPAELRPGDRVQVLNGAGGARVERI